MGAVAIWCMHYIGNRATIMCNGETGLAIRYSPGFTAGSFFLAISGVFLAFYFFSITGTVTPISTLMGGLLMGGAICGMHYLGQVGIANYRPSYDIPYVVGAATISVTASTIALSIFFFFKAKWTNKWYKRVSCAALLAAGVSGMHWCATVGTNYKLITVQLSTKEIPPDRVINAVTILVSVNLHAKHSTDNLQAICACLALIALSFLGQRSKKRSEERAKQVILACVIFDQDGKLMVNSEGLLPCRKITNAFLERVSEVQDVKQESYAKQTPSPSTMSLTLITLSFHGYSGLHALGAP